MTASYHKNPLEGTAHDQKRNMAAVVANVVAHEFQADD